MKYMEQRGREWGLFQGKSLRLRKTTKYLRRGSSSLGRFLNLEPPEYEAGSAFGWFIGIVVIIIAMKDTKLITARGRKESSMHVLSVLSRGIT